MRRRINEKSDYNALRRAKEFIKNATSPAGFYDKIREILKDAFIEDWDIKQLQRLADAKYYELTRGVKEGLNNRRDRTRFITKMVDALVREPYGYSRDEANDIAIKHADDVSTDWCGYGDMDACIRARLRRILPKKEYDAEYGRSYRESYRRRGLKESGSVSIGDEMFRLNGINLKDWYTSEYPDDELGYELNDDVDLRRCFSSLGKDHPDIYDVMGVGDSLIRERVFAKIADVLGVDYDVIYRKWLDY